MNKLNSRKLWAFVAWTLFMILTAIFEPPIPDVQIKWYGIITLIYVLTQGTIDMIIKWKLKGKDE